MLLLLIFWARLISKPKRRFLLDFSVFLYLLPIYLVIDIVEYSITNTVFNIIGKASYTILVVRLIAIIVKFGILLIAIYKIYFLKVHQKAVYLVAYFFIVPICLLILKGVRLILRNKLLVK